MIDRVIEPEISRIKNTSVRILGIARVEDLAEKYFKIVSDSDFELSQKNKAQRENLANASEVYFNCSGVGLGDSIMQLRFAAATARHLPEKKFIVQVPQSLANTDYLNLPSNIILTPKVHEPTIMKHDSFAISLFPPYDFKHSIYGAVSLRKQIAFMEDNHRIADYNHVLKFHLSTIYKILGIESHHAAENLFDVLHAIHLRILGIKVKRADLEKPFLKFSKADLDKNPVKRDILIAPDAKENRANSGEWQRSRKSISPEKWGKVFAKLPKDLTIGIVIGTEHPDYCKAVYEEARKAGLNVTMVKTPTLTQFCEEVLASRKFVGMDSGTTHLASEAILAAKVMGRNIQLREVFNSASSSFVVRLADYGIRGLGDAGKILDFRLNRIPLGVTDLQDIDNIEPSEVAEFII